MPVALLDIGAAAWVSPKRAVGQNDLARVKIRTQQPLTADMYETNRATGAVILIDEATNETVAAGFIRGTRAQATSLRQPI
jgi:sulfate adenylyltransferase subunit 1